MSYRLLTEFYSDRLYQLTNETDMLDDVEVMEMSEKSQNVAENCQGVGYEENERDYEFDVRSRKGQCSNCD